MAIAYNSAYVQTETLNFTERCRSFNHCEDMKGNAKCRTGVVWGLWAPKVTGNVTIR